MTQEAGSGYATQSMGEQEKKEMLARFAHESLLRLKAGDETTLDGLIAAFANSFIGYGINCGLRYEDAEEAMEATFTAIYFQASRYDEKRRTAVAWMWGIHRHKVADKQRAIIPRMKREEPLDDDGRGTAEDEGDVAWGDQVGVGPEFIFISREAFRDAWMSLPHRDRSLIGKYLDGELDPELDFPKPGRPSKSGLRMQLKLARSRLAQLTGRT